MGNDLDTAGLNRAGRRAAEKRAKRMRTAGAVLAAGAATFGTTATLVGVTATTAGATDLTVNSLLDNGDGTCDPSPGQCTLRDALDDAANGDTILFEAGLSGTITLVPDQLTVNKSVTIQGPGAGVITVDGNNTMRVFDVAGPDNTSRIDVVISGLTLTHGNAGFGAGILVSDANLTVREAVITGNISNGGGGIAGEDENIDLVVENSQITGNTANNGGDGGGIYWYSDGGSATITNSDVSDNTASGDGGGAWIQTFNGTAPITISNSRISGNTSGAEGGGLSLYFDAVNITNSLISGNTSDDGGGGIWAYYIPGDLTITNTTISGNTAGDKGGGLYAYWVTGDVTITGTTISGNSADAGGGAFFNYLSGDSVNIVGSVISGNHAVNGYGGGLYFGENFARTTIAFSTMDANTATESGGAIEWYRSDVLRVLNTTISGNTADAWGGGLYISSNNYDVVEIFNSTISGNTADSGGGIAFASYYGLEMAQSTITGNTAGTGAGLFIYCVEDTSAADSRHVETKDAGDETNGGGGQPHTRPEKNRPVKQQRVRATAFGEVSASGTIIGGNNGTDVEGCGTLASDHSLITTITGVALADAGGTILGKLPLVAPLANNGGPTQTHALLPDSPAINTGPNPVATFEGNQNDQRGEGFPRVVAGVVDIGAYEVQPPKPNFTG